MTIERREFLRFVGGAALGASAFTGCATAGAPAASAERQAAKAAPAKQKRQEAGDKVLQIVRSLERDYDTVWGSMVKQTIRRVFPSFNEEYYGQPSFAALLEDVADLGVIELDYDDQRGNYVVRSKRK